MCCRGSLSSRGINSVVDGAGVCDLSVIIIIIIKKNLEAVPGKHSIDSLQKTAILGTSHIIRKVLQCEAVGITAGSREVPGRKGL
jgi:hypothetical protein